MWGKVFCPICPMVIYVLIEQTIASCQNLARWPILGCQVYWPVGNQVRQVHGERWVKHIAALLGWYGIVDFATIDGNITILGDITFFGESVEGPIGQVKEYPITQFFWIPNQITLLSYNIYDFHWVFIKIQIVGMLLTCPTGILCHLNCAWLCAFVDVW